MEAFCQPDITRGKILNVPAAKQIAFGVADTTGASNRECSISKRILPSAAAKPSLNPIAPADATHAMQAIICLAVAEPIELSSREMSSTTFAAISIMPSPSSPTVKKRSVFLIGGYEPKSSDAFFKRTRRELGRFCECWDVQAAMQDQSISSDGLVATAQIDADMQGDAVRTNVNFFVWNDIVLSDFRRPTLVRVAKYATTFADYLLTGTFFRIVASAWRFSLYFLYPAIALGVISLIAAGLGLGISSLGFTAAGGVAAVTAAAAWWGLLKLSGRRWYVMHLMDLWSFSRDYLYGRRPDAQQHIHSYAQAVVAQAQQGEDDEIILVGHSTGGALILDIAATALELLPSLGQSGPRITVLTVGSTALKIGLHPAADAFRAKVQRLVNAQSVNWIECQAMTDVVNFYKTDPAGAMKLTSPRHDSVPQVHLVRVRDMLQKEAYKRFRYNFFRVHYQFIMANTKQYAYDFFMMCCSQRYFAEQLGSSLRHHPTLVAQSLPTQPEKPSSQHENPLDGSRDSSLKHPSKAA